MSCPSYQNTKPAKEVRPFLRWAGGKSWLKNYMLELTKSVTINNYHEPFLGGGSVFFTLNPTKAFLSDLNSDLISTYNAVQENVELVLKYLKNFENTEQYYYKIRSSSFLSKYKKAAQFIYLNQTSFNGIYRVNLKNEYNVPFGYRNKIFYEPKNLRLVSQKLANCTLNNCDFDEAISLVKKNDLVFLDPPYTVSHNQNGFIKYNHKLFSLQDQYRLAKEIENIKKRGAYFILTNAAHTKIDDIFGKYHNKIELRRASLIGGKNAKRETVSEYLFTNLNPL